jgi:hypothetical protein
LRDTLVCVGGGAAGAVVSVLLRLNRIEHLDYQSIDRGAAAYRIALGWFFTAAFLFLVKGGLAGVFTARSNRLSRAGAVGPSLTGGRSMVTVGVDEAGGALLARGG